MFKKKVLIVDPFSTGVLYAEMFKQHGFDCLALISSQDLPERFVKQLKSEDFSLIFNEIEQCCKYLDEHKLHSEILIVAGSESGVELSETLCIRFNIKMNDPDLASARRDKFIMQEQLRLNAIRHIPSILIYDNSDIEIVINMMHNSKNGYIIKPLKSSGSDGVMFCSTQYDLLRYIENINWQQANIYGEQNEAFLIQPFITGDEYVVDMVVYNNQIYISTLCRYNKIAANGAEFVYMGLEVLNHNDLQYASIINYAAEATKALGFKLGPVHMEIKVDDNSPVMIEVGARMHGGIAPQLFSNCYAPHLLEMSVNSFLANQHNLQQSKLISNGRIVFLISYKFGKFHIPILLHELENLPSYKGHKFFVSDNEDISPTIDLHTCPGVFWLSHTDNSIVLQDERIIREKCIIV